MVPSWGCSVLHLLPCSVLLPVPGDAMAPPILEAEIFGFWRFGVWGWVVPKLGLAMGPGLAPAGFLRVALAEVSGTAWVICSAKTELGLCSKSI